jgi:hypothetical protein
VIELLLLKPVAALSDSLSARATVYSKPNSAMGIAFTTIEPHSQAILEKWLASLRTQ